MAVERKYSMTDVGTRLEHMMQLQDLWSTGLSIATQGYMTSMDETQAKELEIALKLLAFHMRNDFDYTKYAVVINELPKKAEDIKDVPPITTHRDTV